MGAIHTNWNIVFAFTGHSAGMATDAHSIIYNKAVIHIILFEDLCKNNKSNCIFLLFYCCNLNFSRFSRIS
jgi:hypothetical protein